MAKVVVTGTAGVLGPYVARHFLESGYEVMSIDIKEPKEPVSPHLLVNLTRLGECYEIMKGADAVVHLAAWPRVGIVSDQVTFENNVVSTYNILEAASGLGIKKAVIASSESAYGIVFSKKGLQPQYVPIDEEHPLLPEDSYGLSKVVVEKTADMFYRRTGMQVVSMRIGNVITKEKYHAFPGFIKDPRQRRTILWSYIDARDIASACRLAIEKDGLGSVALNLAADDTSMDITSAELLAAEFPEVTDIRAPVDKYQTLLSNAKAKKLLGWQPVHRWRDNVR